MTPDELQKLISQREGLKLDFKQEYKLNKEPLTGTNRQVWKQYVNGQWDEFIKDILALANGNSGVAGQIGYLVIGAGDTLYEDGSRDLFDTSDLILDEKQILQRVNKACNPSLPDIVCDRVELRGKTLTVITIPPSPHVHETTRNLEMQGGFFDNKGQLLKLDDRKKKSYTKSTVFIRINETIDTANQAERNMLEAEKKRFFAVVAEETDEKSGDSLRDTLRKLLERVQANLVLTFILFMIVTLVPTIWFYKDEILPVFFPGEMSGEFNIAVAEFIVMDPEGSRVRSDDGEQMAEFMFTRLQSSFSEANLSNVRFELREPGLTGLVKGETPEERARNAEKLAKEIGAHVIIYGVIITGDDPEFLPEFYVNYEGFDEAAEIIGQHELGSPLGIILPFDTTKIQDVENPALSARANALSLITIGLAYYSIDNFEQALNFFSQAEATPGWFANAGKEVVYILLGNGFVRRASLEKDTAYLPPALENYETALETNPAYARARVGQASVLYLIALGDPEVSSYPPDILEKLSESEAAFIDALSMSDAPESANIDTKVHFGVGQIYLVKSQLESGDWLEKAKQEFEMVISIYMLGNEMIADLASHAYARLGLIARLNNDVEGAVQNYEDAIAIASPFYQGFYFMSLGNVYAVTGQKALALEAYNDAVQIAEFYGYEDSAMKYMEKASELQIEE